MRYLDSSPNNSEYGYDLSIPRTGMLWCRMIWDLRSQSIAIYHAISYQTTPKHQATHNFNENDHLVVVYCYIFGLLVCNLFLTCFPSDFFVVLLLLSISWTHGTTSEQQPNSRHHSACSLSARLFFCLILIFSFFPGLSFHLVTWYSLVIVGVVVLKCSAWSQYRLQ